MRYEVIVSIDPANSSLTLKLITERLNDGEYYRAPINPGFHPYFYADSSKTSRHSIARCMARVGSRVLTDFKMESEKVVADSSILIRSGNQTLSMQLYGDFNLDSQLTLWSDNADEYFCVEPVLTHQNVFAETEGGKFLNEGEKSEMAMNLMVV